MERRRSISRGVSLKSRGVEQLEQSVPRLEHGIVDNDEVKLLKMEIGRLKEEQKSRSETVLLEIQHLHQENKLLKEQLEALGFTPGQSSLSDNEKEFLLQKKCSSAPPSISGAPPVRFNCRDDRN